MMKRIIAIVLVMFLLMGCTMFPSPQELFPEMFATSPEMPEVTEPTLPPETTPPETKTVETTEPEPTEPVTEAPAIPSEFPYIIYVSDPNEPIYSGPGYGYSYEGTVEIATQYTIMEERYDNAGNLWGRLKSGAGWICLSWY